MHQRAVSHATIILAITMSLTACSDSSTLKSPSKSRAVQTVSSTVTPLTEDRIVITICIPMDQKDDTQSGHIALEYRVHESGKAVNVRVVYDWAHQADHRKDLTKEQLENAVNIVQHLPEQPGKVPRDRSVIVAEYRPEGKKERTYDRAKLPATMKELFSLLGGIREEVRDDLRFDPESVVPPPPAQPATPQPSR